MISWYRTLLHVALCVLPVACSLRAQDLAPDQPFQAVHLLFIDVQQPGAEASVRSAIATLNQAIAKAGCAGCTYHLWKVVGPTSGSYNYVQISEWPSGTMYNIVHNSPEYLAASKSWESLRSVVMKEAYNRYIEVPVDGGTVSEKASARHAAAGSVPFSLSAVAVANTISSTQGTLR